VKLGHPLSVCLLSDLLADFPPQAILARGGLIQALLEVLGATHIQDDSGTPRPYAAIAPLMIILLCCCCSGRVLEPRPRVRHGVAAGPGVEVRGRYGGAV
jgi:hypothetical protein